jgi:pilus assembly protein Flp/PilA
MMDYCESKGISILKDKGQGLVAYAPILMLIAIVVIGILTLLGNRVSQIFSQINSGLSRP